MRVFPASPIASARERSVIRRESLALSTPYEAPGGELEKLIAGIFAEVFDVDLIGANDDFFDVGGDSLVAETLSMVISERTGRDFQISTLIEHGSPRRIAALLGGKSSQTTEGAIRPPIFIVHGRGGFTLPNPAFRQAFAEGQELYVFELPGIRGGRSYDRIEEIAAIYVTQLVERCPQGPILLSAFCTTGGLIALEMASQLAEIGRPVCQLLLLDPGLPKNRVVNNKRDIKRKSRLAYGTTHKPSKRWLRTQLLLYRLRRFACLITRKNADFADDERRFRNRLLWQQQRGRSKYPEQRLSIDARAKLHAACIHYKPRVFHGPVAILSAPKHDPLFRDPSHLWSRLLPQRCVHLVFEKHDEISSATAARLIQSIFDAALAELDSSAGPGHRSSVTNSSHARPHLNADMGPMP
jgi:thioesterase domain-containing protein